MTGKPSPLLSSFRLSYYTLLNLLRRTEQSGHDIEYLIQRSFEQFQYERSLPAVTAQIKQLEAEAAALLQTAGQHSDDYARLLSVRPPHPVCSLLSCGPPCTGMRPLVYWHACPLYASTPCSENTRMCVHVYRNASGRVRACVSTCTGMRPGAYGHACPCVCVQSCTGMRAPVYWHACPLYWHAAPGAGFSPCPYLLSMALAYTLCACK